MCSLSVSFHIDLSWQENKDFWAFSWNVKDSGSSYCSVLFWRKVLPKDFLDLNRLLSWLDQVLFW